MTKEQASTVPEELYNLTQLAEVTLAAVRLSTTNITEIEDYINARKNVIEKEEMNINIISSEAKTVEQHTYVNNLEFTESVNKPIKQNKISSFSCSNSTINTKFAFYSSSDDDSNYYSHKVFDRRKSRRSTISDHSRFDDHSCSSVPSCCGSSDDNATITVSTESTCNTDMGNVSDNASVGSSLCTLDDEHICPECGKKYSTSSNLARHRQTHRSIMDKKARRCPYCEKVYVSMPAFSMHVRTHNQGCECQYCGKRFSRPWLLQGHIRTHTGEKPFKCNVCNKAFADKSNLRAHIQTHSNTKPHTCKRCGKAFALKSYLYKHEESSCMKNYSRLDREVRATTRGTLKSGTLTENKIKTHFQNNVDSAKSTLATKLLQKERERHRSTLIINNNIFPTLQVQPETEHLHTCLIHGGVPTSNFQLFGMACLSAENRQSAKEQTEKSYIMVTNPMSQEDYDKFQRISVIQPTGIVPPSQHNIEHNQSNNQSQDKPVDFSPKSNLTHLSKASSFELSSGYAILA